MRVAGDDVEAGRVGEGHAVDQHVVRAGDVDQPRPVGAAFLAAGANIFSPALPPYRSLAVDGPFTDDGDVLRIGDADKRQPAVFRCGIFRFFISAPGCDFACGDQRRVFLQLEPNIALQKQRVGQIVSSRDQHRTAPCGGAVVNRFLNGVGIQRNLQPLAFCAVAGDVADFIRERHLAGGESRLKGDSAGDSGGSQQRKGAGRHLIILFRCCVL